MQMGRRGGKNRAAQRSPEDYIKRQLIKGDPMLWETSSLNSRLFTYYRNVITQMALSRFRWINLPKSCDERYLERCLLYDGMATIAFPKKMPGMFMSLQAVMQGRPNKYDNPRAWLARGQEGTQFSCNAENGVIIYDNVTRFPLMLGINLYARELTHIRITKNMNRLHQQMPFILKGPQEYRQVMVDLFKQISGGEPAVIATKSIDMIDIDVLQTGVEYIGEHLDQSEIAVWDRIYMMLGIANSPYKRERQTEDEVRAQESPSTLVKMSSLSERRKGAEYLNMIFADYLDGEIKVEWRQDNESENWNYQHNIETQINLLRG